MFYRSFQSQRKAFCSHHEIPPRRPQTSISVFPRERPPGTWGHSAASRQPRNVTSPQKHTHVSPAHSSVIASPLPDTPQFTLHLHQLPRKTHTCSESERKVCVWDSDTVCILRMEAPGVRKPWGLPDTASGHTEEGDYLIAASHSAQIKTKVT